MPASPPGCGWKKWKRDSTTSLRQNIKTAARPAAQLDRSPTGNDSNFVVKVIPELSQIFSLS
jgi:hypothetical protein